MSRTAHIIIVAAVLIVGFRTEISGQQRVAAIIEKISGSVLLKQNGKQFTLNLKADIARRLFAGNSVHCEKGGKLTLRIAGRVTELDEHSGWFAIPQAASAQADPRQKAIDEYARIGGRNRGGPVPTSILYSPSDDSFATPALFVIRWPSLKAGCLVSFIIGDDSGDQLWEQSKVDGALGMLNSDLARTALIKHQAKTEARKLTLKFASSCEASDESTFYLLSVANEERLRSELARWDDESGRLFAHLGRAFVFAEARMFAQAAEEYEAALALAPESRDLIKSTSGAQYQIGNIRRAKELEKRLTTILQ